nr:TP53-binding protein 1 isoform X6 [Nothobranchius furzeri]
MDPGGSELDSSLPQPENPCLIVEDSQPDSVALEDDPETSYRALLARRLSSLQPTARSPVLELISSPLGSRFSQSDSQSENNSQAEPDTVAVADPQPEESQVLNIFPPTHKKTFAGEDSEMDPGADSTTNCTQAEGGSSQFGFLELSQSQDLQTNENTDRRRTSADQNISSRTSESQDHKAARSEVSSSSSSECPAQSGHQINVQVLLHSQNLQASAEQDHQDCEVLSSQEDLFAADKSAAAVDSTVSEPEQRGLPTPTPGQTLHLLHLSGQGTLVQQSLSQTSVDFVAPTPEHFSHTPLIIPSSPTEAENEGDEPMDTSLPPQDRAGEKEEPMETEAELKPRPSVSTPSSQNSSILALGPTLPLPSQPEFSHDAFVPTQSQEAPQQSCKKSASSPREPQSQHQESARSSSPLQLSVNTESCDPRPNTPDQVEDDSQATQIEELGDLLGVDTGDSLPLRQCQKTEGHLVLLEPQTSTTSKASIPAESAQHHSRTVPPLQSDGHKCAGASLNEQNVKDVNSSDQTELKLDSSDVTVNSCVPETPSITASCSLPSQTSAVSSVAKWQEVVSSIPKDKDRMNEGEQGDEEEEVVMEAENTSGVSGIALVLSQSQMLSPEPMEDEESQDQHQYGVIIVTDSERSKADISQPVRDELSVSANGHQSQSQKEVDAAAGFSQMENVDREPEGVKDKSLSDSSGDISFHFTLPKEGELIGPAGATPPLINQLKQTLRHSTPIEIAPFSERTDVVSAASDGALVENEEDAAEKGDGRLSLRMKLVTPVEEGSSERFSLQKPTLEDGAVAMVTTVSTAVSSSPSVFTRVRQVHRQQEAEEDHQPACITSPVRGKLFSFPLRSSQTSSLGCSSLPNSQSEQQDALPEPQENLKGSAVSIESSEERRGHSRAPPPPPLNNADVGPKSHQTPNNDTTSTPPSKLRQRTVSQQTSLDGPGLRSPPGRGDPESPSFRRAAPSAHRRHVRTTQEVRTTVTRIITDVYYEDGKEVDRRVTEESEEPVVDFQVLDSDISPCRTGSCSLTSGDLGDISSLSSKASSLHQSSGGTSGSTGNPRPDFLMPSSRGAKSSRGVGIGSLQRLDAQSRTQTSSEDEPYSHMLPPRLPASPTDPEPSSRSDSLRSSPDETSSAGSSFVGLRVVAKWSSNGYFYSGRIIKDAGEGSFRLRFDDGYECEVAGKDILLCDPIPLETEVTALLEDEYFSIGVIKGHKTEGQDLFYNVEKDGQRQWYNRTAVILSLEQGNKLREQHSLGPYEPSAPLAKASDISLDNLVEGKRRRRGTPSGQNTPNRSSSSSPRTPGPSGKRKLMSSEETRTPSKRGRRGGGARAAQRVGVCNTSGSGTDLADRPCDISESHGPLPQNASLFMGFAFMLTASSESDRVSNKTSTSDEEEDYVQTGPYNKAYTESQLQAGGGFILPDFNEEQCKAAYQSLLIADQHCRTRKYLLCLASGVPCVSHIWVRDCCKENKLLNYRNYLLPAGVGPNDAIMEWHPRSSPFKALRVLLVFEKTAELWAQLMTMGGASSVRHFQPNKDSSDIPAGKYDVVVTDQACPPQVEKKVTSQEVPLVSPEWLIQSLICGECLGFHSQPQFHHDHSSSSSTSSSS